MLAGLSEVKVAPGDVEQYVEMRRRHINPALVEQPGFRGSTLLRADSQPNPAEVVFALFNFWADEASAKAWATAPRHDEVSEYVIPLVRSITSKRYELVENASATAGDEGRARVARISVQQVKADRVQEYLDYRRSVIHPSMARADGFVAAWVLRDVTDPARFAIYLRWASARAGEDYFHSPHHLGEITDRVKALLEGSLTTNRYEIVAV
jgi:heme-degrading monooxygenase HmoA